MSLKNNLQTYMKTIQFCLGIISFFCSLSQAQAKINATENQATAANLICERVVAVVDTQWPPYGLEDKNGHITGLSVDLIQKIFSELDLPIVFVPYSHQREIDHALRLGDIDMVLAAYEHPKSTQVLDFIRPGFLSDPYMVASREEFGHYNRFEDLIGHRGLNSEHFFYEKDFDVYRRQYLYVQPKGTLENIMNLVLNRKADYVLGSRYQLEYALDQYGQDGKLVLLSSLSSEANVHMAFSKVSKCHAYMAYVQKRLLEFKQSGIIDAMLENYVKKRVLDHPVGAALTTENADPKLDYGF